MITKKQLRQELGLTDEELTRAWNVGRRSPDGTTALERIAQAQLDKLFKRKDIVLKVQRQPKGGVETSDSSGVPLEYFISLYDLEDE